MPSAENSMSVALLASSMSSLPTCAPVTGFIFQMPKRVMSWNDAL